MGHELRRPEADLLRDGNHELRIGLSQINYRLLHFFSGKDTVIVSHGFTKEAKVPAKEIALAIARRERFRSTPPSIRSGSDTMPKTRKRSETTDAVEILNRRYFEGKPEMMAMLEEELINAELSRLVYDLRTGAKLTQARARQAWARRNRSSAVWRMPIMKVTRWRC